MLRVHRCLNYTVKKAIAEFFDFATLNGPFNFAKYKEGTYGPFATDSSGEKTINPGAYMRSGCFI